MNPHGWLALAALLPAPAVATGSAVPVAAVPLFRDPVHDGAADPSIVRDRARGEWVMFYTNRRAELLLANDKDVSWVHGTAIGLARSRDGATWRYAGTAAIPRACTGATLWAPEVQRFGGLWHLWLTVVPGNSATGTRRASWSISPAPTSGAGGVASGSIWDRTG